MFAGKYLLAAKAKVGHGGWLKWFAENCPGISEDTSERYRNLAEYAIKEAKANSAHWRNLIEAGSLRQAYIAAGVVKDTKDAPDTGAAKSKRTGSTNSSRPQPSEFVRAKGLAVQLWNLLTSTTDPERMANEIQPVIQWQQDYVAQKQKREAALNDGFDAPKKKETVECCNCGQTATLTHETDDKGKMTTEHCTHCGRKHGYYWPNEGTGGRDVDFPL